MAASGNTSFFSWVVSFTMQEGGMLHWLDSQVAENGYSEGFLFVQES